MASKGPSGLVNPQILNVPPSSSTVSNAQLNVSDDTKRWITVGIALNTALVPALRQHVDHKMKKFYSDLCKSHSINAPNHGLTKDPGKPSTAFDNRSINKIKDHHELAKLYLQPFMVKFNAITDEAFDASAILNVMERASCFLKNEVKCSRDVRNNVRNDWAHCQMKSWDTAKYLKSFNVMENMANILPNAGNVLKELKDWRLDGIKMIGKNVDKNLVAKMILEADNIIKITKIYAENFTNEVEKIIENLETVKNNYKVLENRQIKLEDEQLEIKNVQMGHSERLSVLEKTSVETGSPLFDIPNRNHFFVGRSKLLADMEESLLQNPEIPSILTCSGLGGVGKTSIAVELCHKMKSKFPGGIYWLTADSECGDNIIRSSLFSLVRKMNQMDPSIDDDRLVDLITNHLVEQERSLLVIDNLDAVEFSNLVNKLVNGRWFRSSKVSMLVTSRLRQDQLRDNIDLSPSPFLLESFDLEEGVEFLKQRTEMKCDDLDAKDIVLELGGLPLALEQASAYIVALKCTFPKYLERIKKEKIKILDKKKAKSPSEEVLKEYKERLAVNTTWSMNMKCIQNECPEAYDVMPALAFLSPRCIPKEILNQGIPRLENEELANSLEDDIDISEIIFVLTKLSLFDDTSTENVTVHRMVQDIVKEETKKKGLLNNTFQNILRMLTYAIRNGETPSKYLSFDAQKQWETSPLLRWAQIVENLGHFLDEVKKLNMFDIKELQTLQFIELLDHAALYYYTINQTDRSSYYKQLSIESMSNMDLSSSDVIPIRFSLPLSKSQKEYLYQLIDPSINAEKKKLSSEDKETVIRHLNDEGDLQLVGMNWSQASLSYTKSLEIETSIEHRQKVCLKLCRAFYEQGYLEQMKKTTLQVLAEDPQCSTAYLWMAIYYGRKEKCNSNQADKCVQFPEHSNFVYEMTSNVYGELGYVYGSLALHFSNNDLEQMKLLTNFGFYMFRTKVVEVQTSRELEIAILNSSSERIKRGQEAYGERHIILVKSGIYKISQNYLMGSFRNIMFGENFNNPPSMILDDKDVICRIAFPNIFMNISFQLEQTQLDICQPQIPDFPMTTMFFHCKFESNCPTKKSKLSAASHAKLLLDSFESNKNMTPEEAEMKDLTPKEKLQKKLISDHKNMKSAGPAIVVSQGRCGLINCEINASLGGGMLVAGVPEAFQTDDCKNNPFLFADGCTIRKCGGAGLEARDGGSLLATNCNIHNNRQGILIWKAANKVDITNCKIYENKAEGILAQSEGFSFTDLTEVKLYGNDVHHNNLGISTAFLKCVDIQQNSIFSNNWGIFIRNAWTVIVQGNDIKRNYLGGIRCCLNRFDSTLIRNNRIHDHTGPDVTQTTLFSEQDEQLLGSSGLNRKGNSRKVLMQDNITYNNELSYEKVSDFIVSVDYICHYCQKSGAKLFCSRCGRVRYCSGNCQKNDIVRHKTFCKYFQENHTVEIKLQHKEFNAHPGIVNRRYKKSKKSLQKSEFLVKVQAGNDGMLINEGKYEDINVWIYDESRTVSGISKHAKLFDLVREFGKLGMSKMYSKKIYFYAKILGGDKDHIQIRTDDLIHDQTW